LGRDQAGEPVAQGDPLCAGHANRIYARVFNIGGRDANAQVSFEISAKATAGLVAESDWKPVGKAVTTGRPGSFRDVYITYQGDITGRAPIRVTALDGEGPGHGARAVSDTILFNRAAPDGTVISLAANTPNGDNRTRYYSLQLPVDAKGVPLFSPP